MSTEQAQEPVEQTIERLRQGIEAFNRRDLDGAMAPLDPDVELVSLKAVLEGSSYNGREGMRRLLKDMGEDWDQFQLTADEFLPVGDDRLLVMGHLQARGKASGVEVNYAAAWLCNLRAGKVVRVRFYDDRDEALAAARG
jgi:ketosteroid isomerase-like protein